MPRSTENTVTVAMMVIRGRSVGVNLHSVSGLGQHVPMGGALHALVRVGGYSQGEPRKYLPVDF